jgi:DNA primase
MRVITMAGRIPDSFIDELLARVDIVSIIEQRVPLKKAGRDWSARCPFHDERSPSFTVSPAKQFYHCFGCGKHGSAIKFLMDYDRLEFVDAVEELANQVGLKVPYEGGARRAPQEDSTDLYALLDSATKFYQRALGASEKAKAYFETRGLHAQTIERFALGYAPDQWDALKSALGTTPQRIALLEKSGMLTSGERGTKYDRFRDRVMFPIQDRRGRVIAFGGRVLGDDTPKYLNSPETPLFHKGQQLFALWQVRQAHSKIPRLIVVEGYMDVISLFQHGITQAVATLGTATRLGESEDDKKKRDGTIIKSSNYDGHTELLFRNSSDVYFCFDGDRAGRQAAWRAMESVLPRMRDGRQAFFLFLPDGEDPDSIVRTEGREGFEQRLREAAPLSEFFFSHQEADTDLRTPDGRARLVEQCKELLARIPDGAFRDRMYETLAEKSVIQWSLAPSLSPDIRVRAEELLNDRVIELKRSSGREVEGSYTPIPTHQPGRPQERTLVRTAVALIVQNPGFAAAIPPPHLFSTLRQAGIPLLVELIALCRERPEIAPSGILEHFAEREELRALQKLAVMEFPGGEEEWRTEFLDALAQLDRQTQQQRLDDLLRKKSETSLSDDEKDELRRLLPATKPPLSA